MAIKRELPDYDSDNNSDRRGYGPGGRLYPVPDPTALTTEALIREIGTAREMSHIELAGVREVLEQRIGAIEVATKLLQTITDRTPEFVRDQVGQLRDHHDEKFRSVGQRFEETDKRTEQKFDGVATQFLERDKRTEQLSLADKTAVSAALQAQKESAGATQESNSVALVKMETNFTKLIDQGQTLLQAVVRNTDEKINDIKGRLDRGAGKTSVSDPALAMILEKLTTTVAAIENSGSRNNGRTEGMTQMAGWIFAGLVAMVSVLAFVMTHVAK